MESSSSFSSLDLSSMKKKKKQKPINTQDRLRANIRLQLIDSFGKSKEETETILKSIDDLIPTKYQRFGHVLVFRQKLNSSLNQEMQQLISNAFISVFDEITVIVGFDDGIKGELREPTTRILFSKIQNIEKQQPNNNINIEDNSILKDETKNPNGNETKSNGIFFYFIFILLVSILL
jgi:tRNA G37 N-methylase Trm5